MRFSFALTLLALACAACSAGARRAPRGPNPVTGDVPLAGAPVGGEAETGPQSGLIGPKAQAPRIVPGRIPGTPSIRVVWEALIVEQTQLMTSKYARPQGAIVGTPDLEVVLLNASFEATPAQASENRSQPAVGRIARVPDRDMLDLLESFEKADFFEYAKPTDAVRGLFGSDRARGRITVERDGHSVTLLSMRGLGLRPETKEIPGIYAAGKQAIQVLKNRASTLAVTNVKVTGRAPASVGETSEPPAPKSAK